MKHPIFDLHCDLLLYLARIPNASVHDTEHIGVTLPYLKKGNVKLQVTALFSPTREDSLEFGKTQFQAFQELAQTAPFQKLTHKDQLKTIEEDSILVIPAIENASIFCDEEEKLDQGIKRLDDMLAHFGRLFYISFTHNDENRFGGGNFSDNVGLKEDGKELLQYMDGKQIAIDLAHTSDQLAFDLLNYIDAHSLDIPVIASHSNFRNLCNHPRNLPTELVQEVIRRDGLIGINFLRLFIHPSEPDRLYEHILYGLEQAPKQLAFGADFFYRKGIRDPERQPLFFPEHEDASKYNSVLAGLKERGITQETLQRLCWANVERFVEANWS